MDTPDRSILVVDDEPAVRALLSDTVELHGWRAVTASNAAEALTKLESERPDAVITDLRMPGGMDGFQLFQTIRRLDGDLPVIIMSAFGNIETAVESVKCGAFDYLPKPFKPERLRDLLKSLDTVRTLEEKAEKKGAPATGIIGCSSAMVAVRDFVERAARFDSTVFIQGEPGTGREFIARAIHLLGERAEEPFVSFRCVVADAEFIEKNLFGSEDGSGGCHAGLIEEAGKGALFLDEVVEMSGHVQGALLQAIEDGESRPVGGERRVPFQARLMVASSTDLNQALQNGQFRRDLFYRLHVLPIHLPPLRSRTEDIPLLFEHFMGKLGARGIEPKTLTPDAQAQMISYNWPGNVHELENCVERAAVMATGTEIGPDDLPAEVRRTSSPEAPNQPVVGCRLCDYEHAAVLNALRISNGNKRKAARILEISIATLYKKLKDYSIEV